RPAYGALLAIAQLRRDPDPVAAAAGHQLHAFLPARHHLVEGELGRLAALAGAVEHLAVEQAALVVHPDPVRGTRAVAFAFLEHFVLQAAFGDLDLLALGVLREERSTLFCRPRAGFRPRRLHPLAQVLHDLHELLLAHP